jgi:hypothetical protein
MPHKYSFFKGSIPISSTFVDSSRTRLVKIFKKVTLPCLELYEGLIALGDTIFYLLVTPEENDYDGVLNAASGPNNRKQKNMLRAVQETPTVICYMIGFTFSHDAATRSS